MSIKANPGKEPDLTKSAQNGTIWSTPCAPGYHKLFCIPCDSGTYKTEMSNVDCLPC